VPRYFLSVRYKDGVNGLAVDEEGDELPDATALREHTLETARDLLSHSRITGITWSKCTFEVTDEAGDLVMTVPFAEAEP
jgi:hypothetical protein